MRSTLRPQAVRTLYLVLIAASGGPAWGQLPVPTTLLDFYMPGTQAGALNPDIAWPIESPDICFYCHRFLGDPVESDIHGHWRGSMMGQATRDPLFLACLQVANADATASGDICLRCHTPKGWLEGRSVPTDGSLLIEDDRHGISCNFCHRMVSIEKRPDECDVPGASCNDDAIRQALLEKGDLPLAPGNGSYIIDPYDLRRGPFADAVCASTGAHEFQPRSFYRDSGLCGTCHDVSNPAYTRVGKTDVYQLGPINQRHPTGDKYDMFPIERTYSEWLNSDFAKPEGVDMGGRFGGNFPVVGSCQTCHMPRGYGDQVALRGCVFYNAPTRLDQPLHQFLGANAFAPDIITIMWGGEVDADALFDAKIRNIDFLTRAATLSAQAPAPDTLSVRVVNETGHKLPSGYPEGRRMWLHVVVRDCAGHVIAEYGHYDDATAELTTADTKVYEIHLGLDAAVAQATGLPEGPGFHFALNNKIYFDNRIPPRGFTNAAFDAVQAEPVGYAYADGQYWDDTQYKLPEGSASATVELYYQTASKEYIEFLRDANPLAPDDPENMGQYLYALWELAGRSAPVQMAQTAVDVIVRGDFNGDGMVTADDVPGFVDVLLGVEGGACAVFRADLNASGAADGSDIQPFLNALL